ncbi:MAG: L-asparaginase, partial [Rubrivivax sp. SCN 70-15]
MPSPSSITVVLGTGGTIAGIAPSADEAVAYRAAQLGVDALVAALPALSGLALEAVQVAQIDSKDMSHAVWQRLVRAVAAQLARPEVSGIVVTHGTDTLEETAYFLHRLLAPVKPVVLTAAMRPATSLQADGPQNLLDAVTVARTPGARGVLAAIGGRVFGADGLRKADAWRLDAFDGPQVGVVEGGRWRQTCALPAGEPMGLSLVDPDPAAWPRVAWVSSHAGFDATQVDALVAAGFDGLVVAGTGNGSLDAGLEAALERARAAGVAVRIPTRCA